MPNKVQNTPSAFQISNVSIKQDADGRYCLNDLHRASGGLQKHQPRYWLAGVQARELIHELKSDSGIPLSVIKGGSGYQGTYVTKELVYAYAMWISPKFHLAVIRAYDALQASNSVQKPEVPANTIDMSLRLPFGERRYLIDCGNDRMNMLPLAEDVVVMTPQQIKQNLPDILPGYYLVDHKEYAKLMTVRGFCEKLLLEDYDDLIG